MGNAQSQSTTDPRFASATRAFTERELEDLRSLFQSLAVQSQSNGNHISPSVFKGYFGIHGPLGDRMFDVVTQKRNDQRLFFEDLVIAKGTYEKGTNEEIEDFIYQLLDVNGSGIVERSDAEAALKVILDDVLSDRSSEPVSNLHGDVIGSFLNAASFSKRGDGCVDCMSYEDFRRWCTLVPSVRKYLGNLLTSPDPDRAGSKVPRLLHLENIESNLITLKKEYAWHIGGALFLQDLEEWKLLYHSSLNGLSFSTFFGSISNEKGPTLLIVKDKEGCVFGGYASQPWERHADFYGDMKCFLFQLYPTASIFRPTGANNNLQWCAVNFSSENIPNGIGFGGQVNHFGLFLTANLDQGHTFPCTTFGSPSLSKTSKIYPEVIECWGVVQKGVSLRNQDNVKGTVLERFKEDRNMLKMVGLANSSE